ncbi:MAG: hypothetical protein K8R59_14965, partial [Thermoanaerobaculales bacterium]|nr:hypothetical protein [Thermoanaerobaculales bacterium]
MYAYDEQGRPTNVVTGVPGAGDEITEPVHALGLSWTEASLRRSKSRADLNRTVERFHYDGAGHLESNEGDRIPAIAEANQDIVALTGLNPRTLEEWWTVNTV